MSSLITLPTGENPKTVARGLYWQGWSISAIAEMVNTPRTTVDGWKKSDGWDDAKPIDRVESTLEARLVQLINKDDKTGKDFKEIDLLGRQVERMAKIHKYNESGKQSDLNGNLSKRGRKQGQKNASNVIQIDDIDKFKDSFRDCLFDYQKTWYQAGLTLSLIHI